jgi:hypothetical protein
MNQHELLAILARGENKGEFINISPCGVIYWHLFYLQQTTLLVQVLKFFSCRYLALVGSVLEPRGKYPAKIRLVLE